MMDQEAEGEPAHHARRPMNAFLMFCKRHRSLVRDKNPTFENRSITKILGEWWKLLDDEEKACYTDLANEYKDAFFTANPDFKWYKLPAPPLRTLSSRPRETKSPDYDDIDLERTNNNSTKLDLNKKEKHEDNKSISMFTPGKLADEANMGGLSSLIETKTESEPNPYYSPISTVYRSHNLSTTPKNSTIGELQNALTETTNVFTDLGEKVVYTHGANAHLTNQHVIDQIVEKRYNDDDIGYQRNCSDDEKNTRSGRSCKGKRYQEFMAVGGLIVNKRQKRDYNDKMDEYTYSSNWEPGTSRSEDYTHVEPKPASNIDNSAETDIINTTCTPQPDNHNNRPFKASDFDLEAKISALPPLSLEKFQQKKRDKIRKKKTTNSTPAVDSSYLINSVPLPLERRREADLGRETVTGSQKRKPRKNNINRLDVQSPRSHTEHATTFPDMMIATEAPYTVWQNMEVCRQPHELTYSVDLFALATLAEVAANTSKLDETSFSARPTTNSGPSV